MQNIIQPNGIWKEIRDRRQLCNLWIVYWCQPPPPSPFLILEPDEPIHPIDVMLRWRIKRHAQCLVLSLLRPQKKLNLNNENCLFNYLNFNSGFVRRRDDKSLSSLPRGNAHGFNGYLHRVFDYYQQSFSSSSSQGSSQPPVNRSMIV